MYNPQPGDFGLTQISGHVGRAIRVGQWLNGDGFSDYEHAFVYLGHGGIVEAEPGGARLAPLSEYNARSIAWYRAPDDKGDRIGAIAGMLIGTPYSFADYAAIAAVRLHLPLSSKLLHNYVANSGHMICSQLVDEAYKRAGVQLFDDGRLPGDVTPGDLLRLIEKQDA
jgi:uncharacterized protein YycO